MLLRSLSPRCKSVDGYERVGRICSGSFGNVYKVRSRETQQVFALKRMNPSMCYDTNGFSILYIREVAILKHVRHENIIRIEEVVEGTEMNDFFIVMEYCDTDLKTFIQRTGTVGAGVLRCFVCQMLRGLRFLHGAGVVHRDLKPSNILLTRDGCLKIADFGLARRIDDHMTNLVVTLWYRPVEVLLGSEEYTASADMWSVGCVVGEMFLGRPVVPGEGEIDQLGRIFRLLGFPTEKDFEGLNLPHYKSLRRPEDVECNFDDEFVECEDSVVGLVRNLLSFNPRDRYSAEEALSCSVFKDMSVDMWKQAGEEVGKMSGLPE